MYNGLFQKFRKKSLNIAIFRTLHNQALLPFPHNNRVYVKGTNLYPAKTYQFCFILQNYLDIIWPQVRQFDFTIHNQFIQKFE